MTKNRALKQAARERAAATGENYTAARRAVVQAEFDRQVAVLTERGVPRAQLEPLRARAPKSDFAIVVRARVEIDGLQWMLRPDELDAFAPIDGVDVPASDAYLITGVDAGAGNRNVTPDDALAQIRAAGRQPLTIDEGLALLALDPDAVRTNAGFSLAGSRCGDRRVPALWVSKGRPKLGWCWAGNPHTWLGTASCAARIGAG